MYSCVKDSFSKCFRYDREHASVYLERLNDLLTRVHAPGFTARTACKWFWPENPDTPMALEAIEGILYLLNKGGTWRPRNVSKLAIKERFWPTVQTYQRLSEVDPVGLKQQSIDYLAKSILINVTVNISVNFVQMMFRYINMTAKKAGADFKDAETRERVAAMKNYIIRGTDFDSTVTDWANFTAKKSIGRWDGRLRKSATLRSAVNKKIKKTAEPMRCTSRPQQTKKKIQVYVHGLLGYNNQQCTQQLRGRTRYFNGIGWRPRT